ncbi:MAG: ComEC family competence protein [Bacteroidales bacterium]|nr:ComEC family competence protein [Bacteroidales bacterium]
MSWKWVSLQPETTDPAMLDRYPLFRPFAAYAAGIALAYGLYAAQVPVHRVLPLVFWLLPLPLVALFVLHFRFSYRRRYRFGCCLLPLLFLLGGVHTLLCLPPDADECQFAMEDRPAVYRAEVAAAPSLRPHTVKVPVRLLWGAEGSLTFPLREKCLLTLERDTASETLAYGDVLHFSARLKEVAPPLNANEFPYRLYCLRRGMARQAYLSASQWEKTSENRGRLLLRRTACWRARIVQCLREGGLDAASKGLVSTMLLGDDSLLDPQLSASYASAGVSHVLCVSGMHVGIIYWLADSLLFFLRRRRLRLLKMLLVAAVIWLYACMAALTPSVVRSAVMFTFVAFGRVFRRQTPVYNSLLTSALLMLLINPLLLFEVGFQLSYLAVWGIVWVSPMLANLLPLRRRLPAYVWRLWSVSIAAQLFTFPLTVCCFHQFPLYFLLSNVVVVVLAPFVIGGALLHLSVSAFPLLSLGTGFVLNKLVWLMNASVSWVEALPGSVLSGLFLDKAQVSLLYALLFAALCFWERPRARTGALCLGLLLAFFGDGLLRCLSNRRSQEVTLYAVHKHYVIELGNGFQSFVFTDAPADFQEGRMDFSTQGYRLRRARRHPVLVEGDTASSAFVKRGGFLQIGGLSFWCAEGRLWPDSGLSPPFMIDYLLIGKQSPGKPEKLLDGVRASCVWLLPGLSAPVRRRYLQACAERDIPVWDAGREGMLCIPLGKNLLRETHR